MRALLFLPLLFCASQASYNYRRVYKNAPTMEVLGVVHTADCYEAGTYNDVTINVGFIDESDTLLWKIQLPPIKGKGNLDRNQYTEVSKNVSREEIDRVEEACFNYAKTKPEFSLRYKMCMYSNILSFDVFTVVQYGPAWKPGTIDIALTNGGFIYDATAYQPVEHCDYDWVHLFYNMKLRKNVKEVYLRKYHTTHKNYLPSKFFVVGDTFPDI
ncbi:hypothetical protein QR680_014321 [Steinernema hermaphroditum]|uniref:Uncharacterized protein n=1 Tax=Steinernema hermaphroditum TaxID=289476 RepID=A0AA39M419_9BILA|nr:hypothetical protein QR680_014321 [Steinernema hermaphroditum]